MKRVIAYLTMLVMIFSLASAAVFADDDVIKINGESYTETNLSTIFVDDRDDADEKKVIRLQTAAEPSGEGWWVEYTVDIPEGGAYKITSVNSRLNKDSMWYSDFNIRIDENDYIDVNSLKSEVYNDSKALMSYSVGIFTLQEGEHKIRFMTNTQSAGKAYVFLFDFAELMPVAEEKPDYSVKIEGETPTVIDGADEAGVLAKPSASGGKFLNFSKKDEPKGEAFVLNYNYNIIKDGEYNLYYTGANVGSGYVSKAKISFDGGEYIDVDSENFAFISNSDIEDYTTTIRNYAYISPIELTEGEHIVSIKIDNKKEQGSGDPYLYLLDYMEFVPSGAEISASAKSFGSLNDNSLILSGSISGYPKNDFSAAEVEYISKTPYIAETDSDGKIKVHGDGTAEFEVVVKTAEFEYRASASVDCYICDAEIKREVRNENGISVTIKKRNDNDENIRIIAVLRDESGVALEIENKEITISKGNTIADIAFKNLIAEGMTVDYFMVNNEYTPLSLKHTL